MFDGTVNGRGTAARASTSGTFPGGIGRGALAALLVLAIYFTASGFASPAFAARVPDGFSDDPVLRINQPTALAAAPDGRMLVTNKFGKLVIVKNGRILRNPALNVSGIICSNRERGLLGVAVDPAFRTNNYIYLYYTFKKEDNCVTTSEFTAQNPVNRVVRYTLSDSNRVRFSKVLINNIPSVAGSHNAGDLHFGKDGYLYVTVGDGGCDYRGPGADGTPDCGAENSASRDQSVLLGKVLRITRDGDIPATNPNRGPDSGRCNVIGRTASQKCQETFAWGFRNPFRFAFDPNVSGTRFFVNDVGQRAREEIDEGQAGEDFGWNICEGSVENEGRTAAQKEDTPYNPGDCRNEYTPPVHEYSHQIGCRSITGGAFVPRGIWGASYNNTYLFADFICSKIFMLTPRSGGGFGRTVFASNLGGRPIHLAFGSYKGQQDLYYTLFQDDGTGQVRRISQ
jgi:glucose/arabinose dehydrogenase